jgi:drug/metabolite transporter (DMT)-like permease
MTMMTPTSHPDIRVTGWMMPSRPAEPAVLPLAKPTDNVPLGILWMIGATVLLAVAAAVAKWQTQFYPVGEVMFVRSFAGLVACAALILPSPSSPSA